MTADQKAQLKETSQGLALVKEDMVLIADFSSMKRRIIKGHVERELVVKAARVKGSANPLALDATAGLGEDSLLLAAAGFHVVLCERDPLIAALLADALSRARSDAELAPVVARMTLIEQDSVLYMRSQATLPDVIFLDPMFPARTKSAQVKKKLQLIQSLEAPSTDDEQCDLLRAALSLHPRKIVIKRPVHGSYLAQVKPAYSLTGKAVRFDVLVGQGLSNTQ